MKAVTKRALKRFGRKLLVHREDMLAKRARFKAAMLKVAEGGVVAVVEHGMDCDGVAYDGLVREVQALVMVVEALEWKIAKAADGTFGLRLMKPSEARLVQYESRDLTLEAFEEGHPHLLVGGV